MILISHRGNLDGPNTEKENEPFYITNALNNGYDVEVDVWYHNEKYILGHDKPQYETNINFLKNKNLWCHCKNINALFKLLENDIHCFFHNNDDVTLTSKNYMWTYSGKKLTSRSISVLPEKNNDDVRGAYGICSDFISRYK